MAVPARILVFLLLALTALPAVPNASVLPGPAPVKSLK